MALANGTGCTGDWWTCWRGGWRRAEDGSTLERMARPVVYYWLTFVHSDRDEALLIPASGDTPCKAKNQAFERLEKLKQADSSLPQDNEWRLVRQAPI